MTVKNFSEEFSSERMAKKQKTEPSDSRAVSQQQEGRLTDDMPSEEMLGIVIVAGRTPDLNIVDFSDTISDVEIMPEPEPLSASGLPPRPKKNKKKKEKHSADKNTDRQSSDISKSEDKEKPSSSTNSAS